MNKKIADTAVALLKNRTYSQYELEQKLAQQGYDQDAVHAAIQYVTERGYLNDAVLCDRLLEKYAEMNKYSVKESYMRLRRRGLPAALINERLMSRDEEFEYQAALNLAQKYLACHEAAMPKLVRRLAAKGFSPGTVSKVLKHLRDMSP